MQQNEKQMKHTECVDAYLHDLSTDDVRKCNVMYIGVRKIFECFERSIICLPRLHLFNQK